jgi:hypothetical protein
MEMSWPKIGVETVNLRLGVAGLPCIAARFERFTVISLQSQ